MSHRNQSLTVLSARTKKRLRAAGRAFALFLVRRLVFLLAFADERLHAWECRLRAGGAS